jgi:hypothetical protein
LEKIPGMKYGKELKLDVFKNYNIVYGTVNNKNPKALYINISSWVEPLINDNINYNRIIKNFDKCIRQNIYDFIKKNLFTPFMKDYTIVDFDIRKSGVKFGKKSYLNCEITLFMDTEIPINSEIIKPKIEEVINHVISKSFENNKIFEFHKRKK